MLEPVPGIGLPIPPFPWAPFHQHAEKRVKTRINHVELRFARVLEGPPVLRMHGLERLA